MSEPTVVDAEHTEIEHTIESRVAALEQHVAQLSERQKNILEYFIELTKVVVENTTDLEEE